jgi:hypothetical protein
LCDTLKPLLLTMAAQDGGGTDSDKAGGQHGEDKSCEAIEEAMAKLPPSLRPGLEEGLTAGLASPETLRKTAKTAEEMRKRLEGAWSAATAAAAGDDALVALARAMEREAAIDAVAVCEAIAALAVRERRFSTAVAAAEQRTRAKRLAPGVLRVVDAFETATLVWAGLALDCARERRAAATRMEALDLTQVAGENSETFFMRAEALRQAAALPPPSSSELVAGLRADVKALGTAAALRRAVERVVRAEGGEKMIALDRAWIAEPRLTSIQHAAALLPAAELLRVLQQLERDATAATPQQRTWRRARGAEVAALAAAADAEADEDEETTEIAAVAATTRKAAQATSAFRQDMQGICFRCRQPGHMRATCTARICRKCNKTGHATHLCPNVPRGTEEERQHARDGAQAEQRQEKLLAKEARLKAGK